ncbi:MAG: DUF4298 domain-containing protein [Oscillospiraceae bacterium]|nr:DUF4298 domain-containing protein [Oscillospiraceae bacterium]MBQ4538738.1 DUF4298 domain-containing protein [Oscillospiraceae bacterium]
MELFDINQAIERIILMERCFDALQNADAAAIKADDSLKEQLWLLTQYYQGGKWILDYELDEKGLLPCDLKRGVLSQDAVFDLLDKINK